MTFANEYEGFVARLKPIPTMGSGKSMSPQKFIFLHIRRGLCRARLGGS